ncbi:DUF6436 domain-containing protein [Pseudomonas sp. NW5]|uniref:DUF6436 domain-containing protein n=1 Tax=Pseudomonas sp. NW5 TaxID=2934934 RepID=UPI002020EA1D|nr:DUF6436 domain-containing protein [Pseudomonas sp. NW5]MCL7461305.1 DUF6436 domain-containing protein [Pseudomonas sp. NW5]
MASLSPHRPAPYAMPSSRRKNLLIAVLALCWFVALGGLYAWYQSRYIRPFGETTVLFDAAALRLPAELAGPGNIRVVHLWDPPCPCNVGNQQHLSELIARFAEQGVSFHVWQKPGSRGRLPESLAALQPLRELPGAEQMPASPAVAIWDRAGNLAYLGPYSEGAVCTSDNSFIEPILDALIAGRPVLATGTLAVGCYCPWATE